MMDGLIIDCFAGGGGASTGIEMALDRSPDVAINHDPAAIAMHEANHPATKHYCKNIWQADPVEVVRDAGGGPVAFAWFSPDCKHFSKAKGGKPVRRNIRDLAWVVVLWAKRARPRIIMLENVEEFRGWGPVSLDGKPCADRKGETFNRWVSELRRLGYKVEWKEIRACDFGAPTIRKRLFMIARCDGQPIVWPEPTHGPGLIPYRAAAECIDWSIPCPSIFERKRPLAENTMKRIARGLKRFVIDAKEPFIISTAYSKTTGRGKYVYPMADPLRTITSSNDKALITPFIAKANHTGENYDCFRGQSLENPLQTITKLPGFSLVTPYIARIGQTGGGGAHVNSADDPLTTVTSKAEHLLVTAFLAKHFGGATGVSIDTPLPTTTARGTQNQIVTSHLAKLEGTNTGQPVTESLQTICSGGFHYGEIRAFLIKYYGNEQSGIELRDPMHTVTSKDRLGLVTVAGVDYQIVDIGMRMLSPRELFRAQGFPDSYIIDPEFNGKPMTKTAQVQCCGNSVCPDIPNALIRANINATQTTRKVA